MQKSNQDLKKSRIFWYDSHFFTFLINFSSLFVLIYLWYDVLYSTKTITSGFHFTDDHEFVRIYNDLASNNIFEVTYNWIQNDIIEHSRLRPVYYIHRIFEVFLFKLNIKAYAIHNFYVAIFTSIFLYFFIRSLKVNFLFAIAFVLFSLIGSQTTIFWRLGPNETIGLFFFSASLFLLSISYNCENKLLKKILDGFAVFSFVLSTLSKESFILLSPTTILIYIYYKLNEQNFDIKRSFLKSLPMILILGSFFMLELSIIKFCIGTDNAVEGTSGLGNEKNYIKVFTDILNAIYNNDLFVLSAIAFTTIIIYSLVILFLNYRDKVKDIILVFMSILIFLFTIIPQYIIYYKTGMGERYLIPTTIGYAFIIAIGANKFWNLKLVPIYIRLSIALLFAFIQYQKMMPMYKNVIQGAKNFTLEGKLVNSFLQNFKTNTPEKSFVILAGDPVHNHEWLASAYFYIKYVYKIDSIKLKIVKYNPYSILEGRDKILEEKFYGWYSNLLVDSLALNNPTYNNKVNYIGIMPNLEQNFYYYNSIWFTPVKQQEYMRFNNGYFTAFVKP